MRLSPIDDSASGSAGTPAAANPRGSVRPGEWGSIAASQRTRSTRTNSEHDSAVTSAVRSAAAAPLQGVRIAAAVVQHTRRADQESSQPVERLHAFVDALFPIIATVLFAKNFSEIPEEEARRIKESCELAMENDAYGMDVDGDDCGWPEVGKMMWIGLHNGRIYRLVSTCAVFALVYYDWLASVRIFRQVEHVSKFAVLLQMIWCIGVTVYPLTVRPYARDCERASTHAHAAC